MALPRGVESPISNIFAAITSRRGGPSVLIPEAPPPAPVEEGVQPPKLPPEEPKDIGRRRLLAGLIGGGTGLAIELTPARHLVNPFFEKALDWLNSATKNALAGNENIAFKPDASSGSISSTNTFPVTVETAETVLSNYKKLNLADETTLLFPLRLPEWTRGVNYAFQEGLKEFDPKTGKNILTKNNNWISYSKVPTGTEIYAPIDGTVISHITTRDGFTTGLSIMFTIEGNEYTLKISGTTPDPIFKLTTTNIPSIPEYAKGAQKVVVKRGEFLMTLTKPSSDIQLHLTSTPLDSRVNEEKPEPIKFITATNNTGAEKLLVLSR